MVGFSLLNVYETLAKQKRFELLMTLGMYDERVYDVVDKLKLTPELMHTLPLPATTRFLSRGMVYDNINEEVIRNFIRICMLLSRYSSAEEGAGLSELIGCCGLPEQYRLKLFNFSETYRHMILSESYFPQRAVLKLLAYIFCDDILSDAVAQLQLKTDILNHVNKTFISTPDFVSWRFSVRVMSLAGGFNEDRSDVERTEALCWITTKAIPEFLTYFIVTYFYARRRFYPNRVQGITPRWLARHRALFSAAYCGILGVYANSFLEYRCRQHRILYELRKSQEFRRRRGAARRGVDYAPNEYFNDLEGVTRRIYSMQLSSYCVVGLGLVISLLPLTKITFPKWMGDVPWRYPFIPRFFPSILGMHAASRCLVPFVLAPYTIVSLARLNGWGTNLYDKYVEMRVRMWQKKIDVSFDTSTEVEVDITKDDKPRY